MRVTLPRATALLLALVAVSCQPRPGLVMHNHTDENVKVTFVKNGVPEHRLDFDLEPGGTGKLTSSPDQCDDDLSYTAVADSGATYQFGPPVCPHATWDIGTPP